MTDDQINAAIAAHLGIRPERKIPNFSGDLNEMHEAEKYLTYGQLVEYQAHMHDMAREIELMEQRWLPYSATARYRAEAFLRSIGKWHKALK